MISLGYKIELKIYGFLILERGEIKLLENYTEENPEFEITKNFTEKVFGTNDIDELIKFFHETSGDSKNKPDIQLWIEYTDGTSMRGKDMRILTDTKTIKSFYFFLSNLKENKRIKIRASNMGGNYSVESDDEDWVRAKVSFLDEYLEAVPKQNKYFSRAKYQFRILYATGLPLGAFIYLYVSRYPAISEVMKEDSLSVLLISILSTGLGLGLAYFLTNKIFSLYPEIEFDTTRKHLNKPKRIKSIVIAFVSVILIPLLLAFIGSKWF